MGIRRIEGQRTDSRSHNGYCLESELKIGHSRHGKEVVQFTSTKPSSPTIPFPTISLKNLPVHTYETEEQASFCRFTHLQNTMEIKNSTVLITMVAKPKPDNMTKISLQAILGMSHTITVKLPELKIVYNLYHFSIGSHQPIWIKSTGQSAFRLLNLEQP